MKRRELSPDALRLIVRIGGSIEQCVLDRAREIRSARRCSDPPTTLTVQDVCDSLEALLDGQAKQLRTILTKSITELKRTRQAG